MRTFLKFFLTFVLVLLVSTFVGVQASNPRLTKEKPTVSKIYTCKAEKQYSKNTVKDYIAIRQISKIKTDNISTNYTKQSPIKNKPKYIFAIRRKVGKDIHNLVFV